MPPPWWNNPTEQHAYWLSLFSTGVTLTATVTGIVVFVLTGSSLMLSYGLENAVDLVSDLVVVWRFYCPGELDEATHRKLESREERAGVAIAFSLAISGFLTLAGAASDYKRGGLEAVGESQVTLLIGLSFTSIIIFGFLTVFKLHFSTKLNSPSLHLDGFCSFIGMVLSFSLFMATVLEVAEPSTWWFDPFLASIVGILSVLVGLRSLYKTACLQRIPIYSFSWWMAYDRVDRESPSSLPHETEMKADVIRDDNEIL
mmetsp:Transcript_5203/g.7674  ORF Transcript_5203/g.7674 Transcript_5203/m.7674 type:complete len:258 (+) Transcript_5203:50-823(+)